MEALSLADKVKILVNLAPVSQNELAREAGVSSSQITRMKKGESTDITIHTASGLAKAVGIPTVYLVEDDPAMYMRCWVRKMPTDDRERFLSRNWLGRLRMAWDHLQVLYPGVITPETTGDRLGISHHAIETTIDGTAPLQAPILDAFLEIIGLGRTDLTRVPDELTPGEAETLLAWADDMKRLVQASPKDIIGLVGRHIGELVPSKTADR